LHSPLINAVGLMSGTSLDGLDICHVTFNPIDHSDFRIVKAKTISYSPEWIQKLKNAHLLDAYSILSLNNEFGRYCGNEVQKFLLEKITTIDFIASHGHTVFHDPSNKITTQIGSGAEIYATTGIKTISDFRSVDVALGGQGAPLVPIGDLLLFNNYDCCLNLGGIANASFKEDDKIKAQDICYANMLLNHLSFQLANQTFDKGGILGRKGQCDQRLLDQLISIHENIGTDSLAREGFEQLILPLFNNPSIDSLTTSYHYMAHMLAKVINHQKTSSVFITGGGAKNNFLIQLLKKKCHSEIIIPSEEIIDFKEALIFSFLGLLRLSEKENSLSAITNATKDNIGGAIYG